MVVGGFLGFSIATVRFKMRFFETYEAAVSASLPLLSLYLFFEFVKKLNLYVFIALLLTSFYIFLFWYAQKHYKKIRWYASGRVGFSGLITAGIFFATRAFLALKFSHMLSFVGVGDSLISALVALIHFIILINLARIKQ